MYNYKRNGKRLSKATLIISSIILIGIAITFVLLSSLSGNTVITNQNSLDKQEKMVCESNDIIYPLFNYDNSDSKSMKITVEFEDGLLNFVSLFYKLYYDDVEKIKMSESSNHGALNTLFQNEGLGPDAFNANYSKLSDSLQLSLYADSDDINNNTLKYFLLDTVIAPYTQEKIAKVYTNHGLNCVISKNKEANENN